MEYLKKCPIKIFHQQNNNNDKQDSGDQTMVVIGKVEVITWNVVRLPPWLG